MHMGAIGSYQNTEICMIQSHPRPNVTPDDGKCYMTQTIISKFYLIFFLILILCYVIF